MIFLNTLRNISSSALDLASAELYNASYGLGMGGYLGKLFYVNRSTRWEVGVDGGETQS